MITSSIYFRGHRCFKKDWAGFDRIKPINVIIGKNNTGKSHLLDLVEALCSGKLSKRGWRYLCQGALTDADVKREFDESTSGGNLQGNYWYDHGMHLLGAGEITWEIDENFKTTKVSFSNGFDPTSPYGEESTRARLSGIGNIAAASKHLLMGLTFRRLLADRDVKAEPPSVQLMLHPDGRGASNIIRRYILTSNPQFPREVIQQQLLDALNIVFGNDGHFTEIQIKIHDDSLLSGKSFHRINTI
jgi:hypothetical protein